MGEPEPIPSVSVIESVRFRKDGAIFIDVREQDEWDESRIHGALFRPMSEINDWYPEIPKDETVVVYCHTGARSAKVIHALTTQLGHTNLLNLTGGITAWHAASLPLDTE